MSIIKCVVCGRVVPSGELFSLNREKEGHVCCCCEELEREISKEFPLVGAAALTKATSALIRGAIIAAENLGVLSIDENAIRFMVAVGEIALSGMGVRKPLLEADLKR